MVLVGLPWVIAWAASDGSDLGLRGGLVAELPDATDDTDAVAQSLWALYGRHDYAGVRSRLARIRETQSDWEAPRELMDRLTLGEMRDRLLRASESSAFAVVIKVAAANLALQTCTDMDVRWRIAEAFVRLDQMHQALAAYTNILRTCEDPAARLATMQKAASLLKSQAAIDSLRALGQRDPTGRGEFDGLRLDPVRPVEKATLDDAGEASGPADLDRPSPRPGRNGPKSSGRSGAQTPSAGSVPSKTRSSPARRLTPDLGPCGSGRP